MVIFFGESEQFSRWHGGNDIQVTKVMVEKNIHLKYHLRFGWWFRRCLGKVPKHSQMVGFSWWWISWYQSAKNDFKQKIKVIHQYTDVIILNTNPNNALLQGNVSNVIQFANCLIPPNMVTVIQWTLLNRSNNRILHIWWYDMTGSYIQKITRPLQTNNFKFYRFFFQTLQLFKQTQPS